MKFSKNRISYVKNPLARNSFLCLGLGIISLGLGAAAMCISVAAAGQGGLNTGALGFSSLLAALFSLWYGFLSFREKDRNYILARIGIGLGVVLTIVWLVIIITGIFR